MWTDIAFVHSSCLTMMTATPMIPHNFRLLFSSVAEMTNCSFKCNSFFPLSFFLPLPSLPFRFMQDLEDMLGFRPYSFYYYMWRYVSPAVLVVLIIATVIEMAVSPAGYNAWVEAEVSLSLFMCVYREWQRRWTSSFPSSLSLSSSCSLCALSLPGRRAFPQLPSLGFSHGLRPHCGGHAALAHCLHHPPLQPDVRRLQQAVRLLPQRHDEGHLQPWGAGWAALHPQQEPQWGTFPNACPPRLLGTRRHPGDDQHQLRHQHQDWLPEHWLAWVWAMIQWTYRSSHPVNPCPAWREGDIGRKGGMEDVKRERKSTAGCCSVHHTLTPRAKSLYPPFSAPSRLLPRRGVCAANVLSFPAVMAGSWECEGSFFHLSGAEREGQRQAVGLLRAQRQGFVLW